ncbi:uncharacterized protein ACR2FA_011444 [Aphomia sociella]
MAFCCSEDCGEYAVAPMLVSPCIPTKCCEEPPLCYPYLPPYPKGQVLYHCEKRPPRTPPRSPICYNIRDDEQNDSCCRHHCQSTPPTRPPPSTPQNCCPTCCHSSKPVKTKYVIPCYRYEDGRINQPTVLMRRACEVAVGSRARRKPFVVSSYCADPHNEVHRYHSEDERGNCCFHYERKKQKYSPNCCPLHSRQPLNSHQCQPCVSCPECQYVDSVQARVVEP